MNFVKLIQFTRLVKTDGRLREFNFRKIGMKDIEIFSVNVCNDRGDRVTFRLVKKEGHWLIQGEDVPAWIMAIEDRLGEVIEEDAKGYPSDY